MTEATRPPVKAVLAISSHVARGSVGLRAAGFALERLGLSVWKVPTVWMPWHPGHTKTLGAPARSVTDGQAFEAGLQALVDAPVAGEVKAVLTGYFASAEQVLAACRAIDRLKQSTPDLLVVCDPVSADSHGAYVPDDVITALCDELLPRATLATPNRFEAALLTGGDMPSDNSGLVALASALPCEHAVVTSAFGMMRNSTATLLASGETVVLAEHTEVAGAPHGTGDLFSALLTAHILKGAALPGAMEQATASVFDMVVRSVKLGMSELALAQEQASLVRPSAMVNMRQLAMPKLSA
ncbi:MAG: bifunctional hydroxymethylpyrimidine kinase/phosphomethylpyrimidine kinase [Pseudomonadota bacterium]